MLEGMIGSVVVVVIVGALIAWYHNGIGPL